MAAASIRLLAGALALLALWPWLIGVLVVAYYAVGLVAAEPARKRLVRRAAAAAAVGAGLAVAVMLRWS